MSFSPAGDCLNVGSFCVVLDSLFWDLAFVFSLQECLSSVLTFALRRQTVSLSLSTSSLVCLCLICRSWCTRTKLCHGTVGYAIERCLDCCLTQDLVESYDLSQPISSERPYHWVGRSWFVWKRVSCYLHYVSDLFCRLQEASIRSSFILILVAKLRSANNWEHASTPLAHFTFRVQSNGEHTLACLAKLSFEDTTLIYCIWPNFHLKTQQMKSSSAATSC